MRGKWRTRGKSQHKGGRVLTKSACASLVLWAILPTSPAHSSALDSVSRDAHQRVLLPSSSFENAWPQLVQLEKLATLIAPPLPPGSASGIPSSGGGPTPGHSGTSAMRAHPSPRPILRVVSELLNLPSGDRVQKVQAALEKQAMLPVTDQRYQAVMQHALGLQRTRSEPTAPETSSTND